MSNSSTRALRAPGKACEGPWLASGVCMAKPLVGEVPKGNMIRDGQPVPFSPGPQNRVRRGLRWVMFLSGVAACRVLRTLAKQYNNGQPLRRFRDEASWRLSLNYLFHFLPPARRFAGPHSRQTGQGALD